MQTILFITGGSLSGSEHCLFRLLSVFDKDKTKLILLTHYQDYLLEYPVNVHTSYCTESYLKQRGLLEKAGRYLLPASSDSVCHAFFRKILTKHRPDLIYINSLTLSGDYNVFYASDIPVILHAHPLQAFLYAFDHDMLVSRLKAAKLVVSSSLAQAEVLGWLVAGIRPEVVYPPILMRELDPQSGSRTEIRAASGIPAHAFVWTMASVYFNYNKDPVRFVETGLMILERTNIPVHFLWIGGDPRGTAVQMAMNLAGKHGMAGHFTFTGMAGREKYIALLGASDACMLVSFEESFSIVSAEAIALGKPVLAFDCGGVREIIRKDNGLLVSAFSTEEYVKSALWMKENHYHYDSGTMRESVRAFDLDVQGSKWQNLLETI
ncbi:MAG TPA: glycosyltransferase family 4 protein [Bacteroidales bacterium]|nr:glycosyltransferase family 4 protein [Bacteroidales bacterium]HSA43415.1 glycosyltransferase family 4 protein [Bacteroidales bacterium]